MPGFQSLTNGDISKKREMLTKVHSQTKHFHFFPNNWWNTPWKMINGCWLSCHSPCASTGRTFAADAIISNPPAFAHVHCAEALGIPLLMSFSTDFNYSLFVFFWQILCSDAMVCNHQPAIHYLITFYHRSPTTSFSHPLVNITTSNAGRRLSNYLSYAAADLLTWQG